MKSEVLKITKATRKDKKGIIIMITEEFPDGVSGEKIGELDSEIIYEALHDFLPWGTWERLEFLFSNKKGYCPTCKQKIDKQGG